LILLFSSDPIDTVRAQGLPPLAGSLKSLMAVAEAIAEGDKFKSERPASVVWLLAWPAVALNSLQVVNTLLDRGFIGHLASAALTGYGGSTVITFLTFSLAVALSTGATALVSRSFGANEPAQYKRAAQESVSLSIYAGLLICLCTFLVARPSADTMLPATDPLARDQMARYLATYSIGLPALFLIQTIAASLRGIGDTRSPMYISGVQILLHISLNVLLIFPPRHVGAITVPGAGMGLQGGAAALSISAWIAAVAYLAFLSKTPLGRLSPFRLPEVHWSLRILRIAIPAAVMNTLRVASFAFFTLILKQVPDASAAIAATSIGFALESIMFMPSLGLGAASAALVGQSLGMKRPDRAERLAWTAGHHGAVVTLCLAGPIFIFANAIAMFMTGGKADISNEASLLLRYLCATEAMFAYSVVMMGAMQGAGDTVRPLRITVFSLWVLRVPLATVLALPVGFRIAGLVPIPIAFGLGATGGWAAMSFSQAVQGVLTMTAFKSGRWKTERV
jgi:putative MATE family efflux protein